MATPGRLLLTVVLALTGCTSVAPPRPQVNPPPLVTTDPPAPVLPAPARPPAVDKRVDAEDPPEPPTGTVIVDELDAGVGERHGARGVIIRFVAALAAADRTGGNRMVVTLRFSSRGQPVREPAWRLDGDEGAGTLAPARDLTRTITVNSTGRYEVFVPLVAFELEAGLHPLDVTFQARAQHGFDTPGAEARVVAATDIDDAGGSPVEPQLVHRLDLDMPGLHAVRLLVESVTVSRAAADDVEGGYLAGVLLTGGATALLPPPERWKRPDPQWVVRVGGEVVHRSTARQDELTARWTKKTAWIPLSPGDQIAVTIEDDDIGANDVLGRFTFLEDELVAASGTTLTSGDIKAFRLGGVVRRDHR